MTHKKKLLILIYAVLPLLSGGLIMAGHWLEHAEPNSDVALMLGEGRALTAHLITEAGIAGVIAFLLAATVERLSAHEIISLTTEQSRQVGEDVFKYIFGYDVPAEVRKVIYEDILQIPLLRRNSVVRFTLELLPLAAPSNRCVRVKRLYTYTVENLTSKTRSYTIFLLPWKLKIADPTSESQHTSLTVVGSGNDIRLNEAELNKLHDNVRPGELIPVPIKVKKDEPASVTIETQWERFLEGGHMHFIVNAHTIGLDLFVDVPKNDLVVMAEAFESEILKDLTASEGLKPGSYHWRLDKPLLPYQGIYINWGKKDNPAEVCSDEHKPDVVEEAPAPRKESAPDSTRKP